MPNLLRNQSLIFFAIVYEISKSVIPLSNSVSKNLVIGFLTIHYAAIATLVKNILLQNTVPGEFDSVAYKKVQIWTVL